VGPQLREKPGDLIEFLADVVGGRAGDVAADLPPQIAREAADRVSRVAGFSQAVVVQISPPG
jgi:hypothetical protein